MKRLLEKLGKAEQKIGMYKFRLIEIHNGGFDIFTMRGAKPGKYVLIEKEYVRHRRLYDEHVTECLRMIKV